MGLDFLLNLAIVRVVNYLHYQLCDELHFLLPEAAGGNGRCPQPDVWLPRAAAYRKELRSC